MRIRSIALIATLTALLLPIGPVPSVATAPGGVFVTGHDPDFHARSGNTVGARNILSRAVAYVTNGHPGPSVLLVTSRIAPPSGHLDSALGVNTVFGGFEMAAAPGQGVQDLSTIAFSDYDVVIIASDFGGLLRQAELDILNARAGDLADFINGGGGLVALAESNGGARLTPAGGHFDFLPFLASEVATHQIETGFTVTPFGASLGLTDADVNGSASHNTFTNTGGMEIVDVDASGRILSLAVRGVEICTGGFPSVSVGDAEALEGTPPGAGGVLEFTLTLSVTPCGGPASVAYSTAGGTAAEGTDYLAAAGTVTFSPGELTKAVQVSAVPDTEFEADEFFNLNLSAPSNLTIGSGQGTGRILNDDADNGAPSCAGVAADPTELWPPNHSMQAITLSGADDPDGDAVTLTVDTVTQDEALNGSGDGDTSPDAAASGPGTVQVRAERSGKGDGRVYRIGFTGDDGRGGSCSGTVMVAVPHNRKSTAVDSGLVVDSFGS